jgi:hypothetical protein
MLDGNADTLLYYISFEASGQISRPQLPLDINVQKLHSSFLQYLDTNDVTTLLLGDCLTRK